jgi:hypothetical protein
MRAARLARERSLEKMAGRYTLEQFEADKQAREEREAKEDQERRERTEKESARRAWLADGGRAEDFEKEWPKLRDEGRRRRVVDADCRARDEYRARGVSRI